MAGNILILIPLGLLAILVIGGGTLTSFGLQMAPQRFALTVGVYVGGVIVCVLFGVVPAFLLSKDMGRFAPFSVVIVIHGLFASLTYASFVGACGACFPGDTGYLSDTLMDTTCSPSCFGLWTGVFAYLEIVTILQMALQACGHIWHISIRCAVTYPASVFYTWVTLCIPSLWLMPFLPQPIPVFFLICPLILAVYGLSVSLYNGPWDAVHIVLNEEKHAKLTRLGKPVYQRREDTREPPELDREMKGALTRPLKLVQITDPHIGAYMTVDRLNTICQETVAHAPDLVLLTGDFYTPEAYGEQGCLREALFPLTKLRGRVYAAVGNHDYEDCAMRDLERELSACGITLIRDNQSVVVQTGAGKVELVGTEFFFDFDRKSATESAFERGPPPVLDAFRIVMLHDPSCFQYIDENDGALVFSGHTHGGQIGCVSCGCNWTIMWFLGLADHGFWGNGRNRLYIHRGQGFRSLLSNFVLRIGVPSEQSVVYIKDQRSLYWRSRDDKMAAIAKVEKQKTNTMPSLADERGGSKKGSKKKGSKKGSAYEVAAEHSSSDGRKTTKKPSKKDKSKKKASKKGVKNSKKRGKNAPPSSDGYTYESFTEFTSY